MVVVDVAVAVVCPAGGLVDEARLVQLAHQVNIILGIVLSAGLIEYHPVDDGGGVVVGVDHCRQLGSEHIGVVGHALVLGASVVHRRHVLPHQQAELVGPVVPAARLHLEVLAHHVESVFLHLDDVVLYGLIAGRREVALRPVALVQRSGLENELIVEHHAVVAVLVAAQAYLAHAEVALHLVLLAVVVQQLQLEVVEERVVGVPQVGILDAQHDVLSGLSLALCHLLRAVVGRCLQLGHIVGVAAGGGVDGQRLGINVGHHVEVFYIGGVNSLQPYRLPDAGACRVEDASRAAHLLATGHRPAVGGVEDLEGHHVVLPHLHLFGDVEAEGVVAAVVGAYHLAVDIDRAPPVDGLKVEQHPLAAPCGGHCEGASVSHALVVLLDAAQCALHAVGHQNLSQPRGGNILVIAGQVGKLPQAVEVLPVGAHHLRARILRQRIGGAHLGSKGSLDAHLGHLPLGPQPGGHQQQRNNRRCRQDISQYSSLHIYI